MFFNDINTFFERYDEALIEAHQKFNEVGCFAPIDFYVDTVLKRAMVINGAYVKLAKANNYIAAAPYIRMQMDNCINLGAGAMVKDILAYINHFLSGKELYKFKDERKNSLYEKYIVQEMNKRYGSFKQAYEHYNMEVHLSVGHFFMAHYMDENNSMKLTLEHGYYHKEEEILAHNKNICLVNNVLIDVLLEYWLPMKQNYLSYINRRIAENEEDFDSIVSGIIGLYPEIDKVLQA